MATKTLEDLARQMGVTAKTPRNAAQTPAPEPAPASKAEAPKAEQEPEEEKKHRQSVVRIDPRAEERRKRYVQDRRAGRVSMRGRCRLSVHDYGGQLAGHHHCWVNDYPGELDRYLERGYSPVYKDGHEIKVGDGAQDGANKLGNWVSATVGKLDDNSPQQAFLLKIPTQWYLEDEAARSEERINKEKQIYGQDFEKNQSYRIGKDEKGEFYLNREKGVYIKTELCRKWEENSL